jgi:hypothetical protein
MARSDILVSPPISDEKIEVSSLATCIIRRTEFQQTEMHNSQLSIGWKFSLIKVFREAIRENNLRKGKDIRFKKNYLAKFIVVCKDDDSFEIRSLRPKHSCTRRHKNSIVKYA